MTNETKDAPLPSGDIVPLVLDDVDAALHAALASVRTVSTALELARA